MCVCVCVCVCVDVCLCVCVCVCVCVHIRMHTVVDVSNVTFDLFNAGVYVVEGGQSDVTFDLRPGGQLIH